MQNKPVVIHWQDFRGLRETDEVVLSLGGDLIFRRDGVVYEVDDLAPPKPKAPKQS